jgi:hypothetical protein
MDQCKHCVVRGDVESCMKTECTYHELWYTKILEDIIVTLFDAHYGVGYHDCGNGDGITESDAKLIVNVAKKLIENNS